MSTLKEVADKAGLSVSTVSYVLNGKKRVREETYQRIMAAVDEVRYVPNQLARSLRTKSTLTIGVIVPDISNQFFPEIVKGIEDFSYEKNYNIILCNTDNNPKREALAVEALLSKDIDGIIFIGTAESSIMLQERHNIPIVVVDRKLVGNYISVTTDNYTGGYLATEHFIQSGHRSIALFTGPLLITSFFDRMRGYRDALFNNKCQYNEKVIIECDFTSQAGYNAVQKNSAILESVHAIFATNDLMALGIIRALLETGRQIPADIAVIGYDDIYTASIYYPSLSTVRQPKYEMGKEAASLLIRSIHGARIEETQIEMKPTLVIRETCP